MGSRFISAVAWYGAKAGAARDLLAGVQQMIASHIGERFRPYSLEQVHATLIALNGVKDPATGTIVMGGGVTLSALVAPWVFSEGFTGRRLLGVVTLDLFVVLLGGVTALLPIFARDILAAGPIGLGGAILWSLAFGCAAAAAMLALIPMRAPASVRAPDGAPVTIRGPLSYAGPGSLGGTESALRR